ncbi:formimidoylglutamase [Sphingobacterium hungaricum]|uniref:Formimidoylglutamase n=1 Tax=Sphingobacterium hungaricum TaxID=2082723 RepID=A0A928V1W0_9SPHI|nr:formimidoylglutamase [Sphingobacterium hungaricum]MBE8715446.1 formimidoylglutamase [Sphingobacterium hungaricum]
MEHVHEIYYEKPSVKIWKGRIDGEGEDFLRWHQQIELLDLRDFPEKLDDAYVILGFKSDEGVRRNLGRPGAIEGPDALREILANLPVHHTKKIVDAGNVVCLNKNLEEAQEYLSIAVAKIRSAGAFPIVIGGGHEVTYGHYKGLKRLSDKTLGVINFDAHFDLRATVNDAATSGTGFYQIAADVGRADFHYLALGIQEISNTKALFNQAKALGVEYILQSDLTSEYLLSNQIKLEHFLEKVDEVYLTIDLDAFVAAFAPGVSALAFQGIIPDYAFYKLLKFIYEHPKLVSMDIAELNPGYDIDHRTAKLAADLIFKKVSG